MISLSSLADFSKLQFKGMLLGVMYLLQVVYCNSAKTTGDFSSSIVGMEPLLEIERQLLHTMENYTILLERKLSVIRGAIAEMRAENQKSLNNAEEYLSNPINSFALIRRLHEDWLNWQLFLQNAVGTDEIMRIEKLRTQGPSSDDHSYATEAIYRLQIVSGLKPADMAVGILNGKQYDVRFSSMDCFSIGHELFSKNYFNLSTIWLNISLQLFQDSDINAIYDFDKVKIYGLYAQALQMEGRYADALEAINKALHLSPHKAKLIRTKSEIEFQIQEDLNAEIKEKKIQPGKYFQIRHKSECREIYPNQLSKLHCLYNRTASPFLYLAPFKMEILRLDPYVLLYHDVISDYEIASLKELARPHLQRSQVYDLVQKKSVSNNGRNAESIFIADDTNDLSMRLNQRFADMTGFDIRDSAKLQITNYGLGGNIDLHYDFTGIAEFFNGNKIVRERLSTIVIYMSDVDQGGSTVFPRLNMSITPQKGSALMWYNLDIEGRGDIETIHCSCPVIFGSKWTNFQPCSM